MSNQNSSSIPLIVVIRQMIGQKLSPQKMMAELLQNSIDALEKAIVAGASCNIFILFDKNTMYIYDNGHGCGGGREEDTDTTCLLPSVDSKRRNNSNLIGKFYIGFIHSLLSSQCIRADVWSKTHSGELNQASFEIKEIYDSLAEWDKGKSTLDFGQMSNVLSGFMRLGIKIGTKQELHPNKTHILQHGYDSIPQTGSAQIDTMISKMEDGQGTGTLIKMIFPADNFLPTDDQEFDQWLNPLKLKFPFPEPKIMAIHKKEDGEVKEYPISDECHLCNNGLQGLEYALFWDYQIYNRKPEVSTDFPKEILKLTHRGNEICNVQATHRYFKDRDDFGIWSFDKPWRDDVDLADYSLEKNFTFMMNRLGQSAHIEQLKLCSTGYEYMHLPCFNLMDKTIVGGGENITLNLVGDLKSFVTNIHQKGQASTRCMINIPSNDDYESMGIGGDKTHVTINQVMIRGDLGTIFNLYKICNKRHSKILPTKPEKSVNAEWSEQQETIKREGSNFETYKHIYNPQWIWYHLTKKMADGRRVNQKTIIVAEKEALLGEGFYSPWHVVNDCLIEEDSSVNEEEMEDEEESPPEEEEIESPEEEEIESPEEEEVESPEEEEVVVPDNIEPTQQDEVEDILTNDFVAEEDENENQSRVQLIVTESDEESSESNEEELPISDNTTIPSHNRLCPKTAANARDALPIAWPKMSRNKRMKNFKEDWVQQLTCDEMYAIEEDIIAKQCYIDENAKLCGAAELVYLATTEETPNNSSDSE